MTDGHGSGWPAGMEAGPWTSWLARWLAGPRDFSLSGALPLRGARVSRAQPMITGISRGNPVLGPSDGRTLRLTDRVSDPNDPVTDGPSVH